MSRITSRGPRSLSHHVRTLIGSAAIGALVIASSTLAVAEDATINSMSLETQTPMGKNIVYVQSSTGGAWDTILPGQIEFWAGMQVDTKWPGYVQDAGIFIGTCVDRQCGESGAPLLYFESVSRRDYGNAQNISFSTSKLRVSGILPAPTPYGDEILRLCNKGLTDGKATKPHGFDMPMVVAFTVNTRKQTSNNFGGSEVVDVENYNWGGGDETRHGQIWARVECLATSTTTVDPNPDPHRTKTNVSELDLFLSTVITPGSSPRAPAGQCKPVMVTTRIGTDKAGPVTVKQWRQVDGGPITSETKEMDATALGGGKFGDDWVKVEQFNKTTTVQYKDEVVGGTFAPSTPWKSITVHCNGDYAAPTSDANPDNKPPRKDEADKRRKAEEKKVEEKARRREFDAQMNGGLVVRPFGSRLVALPPSGPRPGFGVGRPMNPYGNGGFGNAGLGHRRVFVR